MKDIVDRILDTFNSNQHTIIGISQEEIDLHSIRKFLQNQNWYIIVIPKFYKNGVNYLVSVTHYNPEYTQEEWIQTDDKSAIKYISHNDVWTMQYGDNHEFPTYKDALKYGIRWCINIIKTGNTDIISLE